MSAQEFLGRLRRRSSPPPIAYSGDEYCYMQAEVPPSIMHHLGFGELVSQLAQAAVTTGGSSTEPPLPGATGETRLPGLPANVRLAQPPRVWVSPAGAVSPMHYDSSHSFLVQLQGQKRMLFLDPDQLPCSYPYPATHLLRRRARVNVAAPDFQRWVAEYVGCFIERKGKTTIPVSRALAAPLF